MKMRNEIMRHFKFDEEWFERQFGKRPERSLYDINNDIDIDIAEWMEEGILNCGANNYKK